MKLWIPTLLMLALFVGSTVWQSRWTSELRVHRDEAWDRAATGVDPRLTPEVRAARTEEPRRGGSARARILIGRPSGAAPVPAPEPPPAREGRERGRFLEPPTRSEPASPSALAHGSAPAFVEPDFTMEVRGGQSLSVICQQHYGSARPGIVKALATYNGLSSPDKIRQGQTLHLPGIDKLLESDRL